MVMMLMTPHWNPKDPTKGWRLRTDPIVLMGMLGQGTVLGYLNGRLTDPIYLGHGPVETCGSLLGNVNADLNRMDPHVEDPR